MSVLLQRSTQPTEPKAPDIVDKMRAAFRSQHRRNSSLSTVPPPRSSTEYSPEHASIAASIIYRSPLRSQSGLPIYILNAAAFPDAFEVDYDTLLAYVLARLPGEEELLAGEDYEVIFFAGGQADSATSEKKTGPGVGWYLQTYHVLSRAIRKRLKMLYVVHERAWVRILIEVFGTIVSPKFKKKIVHVNTLSGLALHIPIEQILIPPSVYLYDRRVAQDIYAPYVSGRRAFSADEPLPVNYRGERRLPRVLRETTSFLYKGHNIQTEGLFRIPAHSQITGILREAYDRGQQFIVWKEGSVSWVQPGMEQSILREVHQADAYGVHSAAGLIKLWYRELRRPIFEESSYEEVRQRFGDIDKDITGKDLADAISPSSTNSFLSSTARQILTLHLLPLLATVVNYEPANKMTAENLAICFAATLVCGSDQLADAKMTSIIRRLLEAAIEAWPQGLQKACGTTYEASAMAISPPSDPKDYEDPLHETFKPQSRDVESDEEPHRIVLRDDDDDDAGSGRPPLPPRPRAASKSTEFPTRQDSLSSPVRRKPAPSASLPPRYSSIVVTSEPNKQIPAEGASPVTREFSKLDEKIERPSTAESMSAPLNIIPATPPRAQDDFMKELKASLAMDTVKRKPVSSPVSPPSPVADLPERQKLATTTQQRSVSGDGPSTCTDKDPVFARPTWAASGRQVSLPGVPQSQASSATPSRPVTPVNSTASNLSAPAPAFRARTPSPGLLQRMNSIDGKTTEEKQRENERLLPQRMGLKKASVDDLRRLYEERAGTVAKLNSASSSRRNSNVSAISRRTSDASLM